jgi:hypothetical protein
LQEPRKHHSVPQSLLRRFSIDGAGKHVFVFDKQTSKTFQASIGDAGAERDFYTAFVAGQSINLEHAFQDVDSRLATAIGDLTSVSRLRDLGDEVVRDIPTLFAIQLMRTKLQRTSPTAIAERLNELGGPLGVEPITISEEQARLIHLDRLRETEDIAQLLRQKDLVLFDAPDETPHFVVSDNPVVLQNTLPYGRMGLAAPGIEIYFPISEQRCLAYLCPSYRENLVKSFDPRHPMRELSDPLSDALMCAFHLGTAVQMSAGGVHFLNELQLTQSGRFLYAATDEFKWARDILERRNELRNVKTLMTIGEMGTVPPTRYRMPAGDWLVFEVGHRHFALPVMKCAFAARKGELTFRTTDLSKLSEIIREQPLDSVAFHASNGSGGGMRDVVIDRVDRDGVEYFRVRHRDEQLRALMDSIAGSP